MIVVYQSFEGQYSDNPRAVYERWRVQRPEDTHVWLAADRYADTFPTHVRTVPIYSPDCTAVLEAADVLVANTHTDTDWVKRPDASYLQTWHGTPLKRIHHDVRWAPAGRLARLDGDVARWDVLLSPNPASTPRLRNAFRFDGPVIESGYPRNDALSDRRRAAIRRQARRRLQIGKGMRAVLYTPTWRDDEVFSDRGEPSPTTRHLPELLRRLDDDTCLLFRVHSFDAARHVPERHPRLRDVSAHPDVAELYLAADVLITDYSSTMFDFAVTGKPLIHFVPDYERFRNEVRGFYFDLEAEAPGPLAHTADELADALRASRRPTPDYVDRYDAFRRRYCGLEDGQATDRVLDLVMSVVDAKGAAPLADAVG